MPTVRVRFAVIGCSLVVASSAMAQPLGELLYTTHCVSCHTTEVHWRDNRLAIDWPSLKAKVRRWQDVSSLEWSDGDILSVSRYLNEGIYHFEQTSDRVSSRTRDGNEADATQVRSRGIASRRGDEQ